MPPYRPTFCVIFGSRPDSVGGGGGGGGGLGSSIADIFSGGGG